MNMIAQFIEEDKSYKEQLQEIRAQEFRMLEQKVFEKFDQEVNVRILVTPLICVRSKGKNWKREYYRL